MYKVINKLKRKRELRNNRSGGKILSMAIIMFISFSLLNVFLILNFISILNNTTII